MQATRAFAVRSGKWKLALCPGSGCPGTLGNTPKQADAWQAAIEQNGHAPMSRSEMLRAPFVQLFDLSADPGEAANLAADHPAKVRELIALLDRQIAEGRSTPGPSQRNDKADVNYLSGVPARVREASRHR
jgi:arylsulfatase A-like enzyme